MRFLEFPVERTARCKETAQILMLADKVTNFLHKKNVITTDEIEVVKFGLESLVGNLLGLLLTLSTGILFKHFSVAVILWVVLFPLRKTVGGYHASTKLKCFCVSLVQLVLSFVLFTTFEYRTLIYCICSFASGGVIWFFAPVENPMKKLDFIEYEVYKTRSRTILVMEGCILIVSLCFKWMCIVKSISMALVIACISLMMGKILAKKVQEGGKE